jgi:hypothetical protein
MEKEQQHQMPISVDPNIYALTNVSIISNDEDFLFALTSGAQIKQFLANPKHAKRIYLLLKQQVENYEKQFGEIKTQLPTRPQGEERKEETGLGF